MAQTSIADCGLCLEKAALYTCPKCTVNYCSVTCYKSEQHLSCSENFYKHLIEDELKARGNSDETTKKKMEEILRKLALEDEALDSDDEEESDENLEERMKNVNLNCPEEIWGNLTEKEREEFEQMLESGKIAALIPSSKPWWISESGTYVQELESEENETPKIPSILEKIPLLSTLMRKKPSDSLVFGLMNVLYGYCAVSRLFMLDAEIEESEVLETAEALLKISSNLNSGHNFNSAVEAVEHARVAVINELKPPTQFGAIVKTDVATIMKKKAFILSALSHTRRIFEKAKDKAAKKRPIFLAAKKINFYLSYVAEYGEFTV